MYRVMEREWIVGGKEDKESIDARGSGNPQKAGVCVCVGKGNEEEW